ncbi:unnamed protein product, partial [Musa textilis]
MKAGIQLTNFDEVQHQGDETRAKGGRRIGEGLLLQGAGGGLQTFLCRSHSQYQVFVSNYHLLLVYPITSHLGSY